MTGFVKAEKRRAKLRLALDGPSGSGKTWTGLTTAAALAGDGRVAVIDTEHGSASLYADRFDFDVMELNGNYDPAKYVAAIRAAEAAGYTVILIDSLSHAWEAEGGVMEIADRNKKGGNSWSGWASATPAYRQLVDAILQSRCHVICTMRTKVEWAEDVDQRGKKTYVKVGTAPVMRQGIDYEFTVVGDLDLEHVMTVTKSRCPEVADRRYRHPGQEFGQDLLAWLEDGGDPVVPVWQSRWAEALERFGADRRDAVMKDANPEILADDAVWERFCMKAAEVDAENATPRGATNPAAVGGGVQAEEPAQDTPPPTAVINSLQLRRLHAVSGEAGVGDAEASAITYQVAGVTSRKHIPVDKYDAVVTAIEAAGKDKA
jgi:hypothetical protein